MNSNAYLFDISRATDAGTLQAYAADCAADETLTSDEREEIANAIAARFSTLNSQAIGKQKPRW